MCQLAVEIEVALVRGAAVARGEVARDLEDLLPDLGEFDRPGGHVGALHRRTAGARNDENGPQKRDGWSRSRPA